MIGFSCRARKFACSARRVLRGRCWDGAALQVEQEALLRGRAAPRLPLIGIRRDAGTARSAESTG
jgi:hypothetical protein